MGSSTSQGDIAQDARYNPSLSGFQIIGEGDTYNIWRNRVTGEEMEEYTQSSGSEADLKYFRDVFEFRYEREHLVSSLYFKQNTRQELCSTFYSGSLFLERIPLRLSEINDLPYPDNLHLANSCLRGFKELYDRVGSFTVSQQLIGINMDAEVKVWISHDFGREKLSLYGEPIQHDELGMVAEILGVLGRIVDHRTEPQPLSNFILRGGRATFAEAITRLEEYSLKHGVQVPGHLKSIADLRDRGYFKKMPPSRKTRFIGQSNYSLDTSNNNTSVRFDSVQPGLPIPFSGPPPFSLATDTISPVLANGTLTALPQPIINTIQRQVTTNMGGVSRVNTIPIVENTNRNIRTYYSNTPVGGSFPISRSPVKRGVSPATTRPRPIVNAGTQRRPLTPTFRSTTPPRLPLTGTPKVGRVSSHINQFSKNSSIVRNPPVVKSVYTEKSLPTQVQTLLKEIKDLTSSKPPIQNVALSGYLSDYTPTYFPPSSSTDNYNYGDYNQLSHTSIHRTYQPTQEGLTNPELLKLTNIERTVQTSYDEFVTASYNPPVYSSISQGYTGRYTNGYNYNTNNSINNNDNDSSQYKSILKNKYQDTANFNTKTSIIDNFQNQYQSQIIADIKPAGSEEFRTIYNTGEFKEMQEIKYTKQVETYKANIRILTPETLHHRQRIYI